MVKQKSIRKCDGADLMLEILCFQLNKKTCFDCLEFNAVCKIDSVQLNDEAIEKTEMQSTTVDGDFFLRKEIFFLRTKIQLK